MKKILITGARSYIGNSFIEYIEELEDKEIQIDKISVRNSDWENYDFTGYDVVLHIASIVHQKETRENIHMYYKVNRDLAVKIAKKAEKCKVRQFIFMSTAAVYGLQVNAITKDTLPSPDTHYGKSKLEAEQEIIKLESNEFKTAIVRPPMVYGYGCNGNFQRLLKLAKVTPVFPDIKNKRSMIHIDNLCEFLRLLIIQEEGGYFHPQNREYVCTSEMMKLIGMNLGREIYFIKIFNPIIKMSMKKVKVLEKMFGNWCFDKEVDERNISVIEFNDSIRSSLAMKD